MQMNEEDYNRPVSHYKFSNMDSFGVNVIVSTLRVISFVIDVVTYPIYAVLQQPWKKKAASKKPKALLIDVRRPNQTQTTEHRIDITGTNSDQISKIKAVQLASDANSVTYRSLMKTSNLHLEMVRNKLDTMEKVLNYASRVHATKRCLGTRELLSEEDEMQPDGRVFKKFNLGDYKWKTYGEVNELAMHFGRGLRELGNLPKHNMVIFAETRAEWMIAAQGMFKQNIPVVTIYATLGDNAIAHGINETEVETVITSHELLPKFKHILHMTPKVKTIIYIEDMLHRTETTGFKNGVRLLSFSEVLKMGATSTREGSPPSPNDTAIIMYTSGSTGVPKGVILSHCNLVTCLRCYSDVAHVYDTDVLIGFLPLAHVLELLVESLCIFLGMSIGYSTALTLTDQSSKVMRGSKGDASILKPTIMTGVPLILDRVSKGIQDKVAKGSSVARAVFKFAFMYKATWERRGFHCPLIDALVFKKVRAMLGGRMRLILSGGAPLSVDTHEFIKVCFGCDLLQGYGLTETCAAATVMSWSDRTFGRVGGPVGLCDVRLVNWEEGNYKVTDKPYPRGEILIGGENVSQGYYKLPGKTAEDFFNEGGKRWFRTGDIGEIHHDGSVKIVDRKKDLVKLQAGEYVSLGKVEAEMKTCPIIENICIYGDSSKHFTVALVVPNQAKLEEMASKMGITGKTFEDLCSDPTIEKAFLKEINEHGRKCKLEKFELPLAVTLCTEVWSPDMGLVTAAFKLKRKDIQERYQHQINRMYAS